MQEEEEKMERGQEERGGEQRIQCEVNGGLSRHLRRIKCGITIKGRKR